ncbi:MAG: response regulator, partial [Cyanobacteria bacterium P01_F01_bin.153]
VFGGLQTQVARSRRPELSFDESMGDRHPLRILLADDHAVNQKVATQILKRMGYRADVAGNGLEVLAALRLQTYDVVLMDVQMPEMDGLSATRRIREEWPPERQPTIVAMTANAMQGDREACLEAGMDSYVSKPIQINRLATVLRECRGLKTGDRDGGDPMGDSPVKGDSLSGDSFSEDRADGQNKVAVGTAVEPVTGDSEVSSKEFAVQKKAETPALNGSAKGMVRESSKAEPLEDEVLNPHILESLREIDFLDESIELYLEDSPALWQGVKGAIAAKDVDKLKDAAHSLKSTSGTMGAMVLYDVCQQLENCAKAGDMLGATGLLPAVETRYKQAIAALKSEYQQG